MGGKPYTKGTRLPKKSNKHGGKRQDNPDYVKRKWLSSLSPEVLKKLKSRQQGHRGPKDSGKRGTPALNVGLRRK